jgi:hypothetical protein
MWRKRKQGNYTPHNTKNIIQDLVESEGDESQVADLRKMMLRMFNECKE